MQLIPYTSLKKACGSDWAEISELLRIHGQNSNHYRVMYAMISQGNVAYLKRLIQATQAEHELFEMHRRVKCWYNFQSLQQNTTSQTSSHISLDLEQLTDKGYHLCTEISSSMWKVRIVLKERRLFEVDYGQPLPHLNESSQTWPGLSTAQRHAYFRNVANRFSQIQPYSLPARAG